MDTPTPHPLRRLARLMVAVFVGLLTVLLVAPNPAFAVGDAPITIDGTGAGLVLTPIHWTMLTGLVIPPIVALLTKAATSSRTKALLAIVLAAVAVVIERATLVDGSAKFTAAIFLDVLFVYGPQVLSYLGFYQPVFKINDRIAPAFGI